MRKITKIEPTAPVVKQKKRVAAYARVSMDTERLQHSLSAQVSYYNDKIQKNPEWLFAGVYADNGISGTGTAKREEFNRLLADCEAGKIDLVLTKSISRFARNTVDLLETVRYLKEIGVEVWFERENIRSFDGDGELLLSILASFAQEESRSISENCKWGIRKRFEKGIPNGHFRIYGYRWEGDELLIVPEEAAVVRRIFQNFLDGKSRLETEREFAGEGITTRDGCRWVDSNIKKVLTNCTYTGDLLLQKEYISDPIRKKRRQNRGELPQYFVPEHHEAIIDRETFRYVQEEMERRKELGALANKSLNTCCFSGRIKCPHCGCSYMHNRRTKNGSYQEYWNCGSRKKKKVGDGCPVNGSISQKALEKACAEVLGLEAFDEDVFLARVDHIEVPESYTLDFFLKDGTVIRKDAPNTGHRDCWTPEYKARASAYRREHAAMGKKGVSCFTSKIKCAECGCNFRGQTQSCLSTEDGKMKHWRCSTGASVCGTPGLRDDLLRKLAAEVMGTEAFDEEQFLEQIDRIVVSKEKELTFVFCDGREEKRAWEYKRQMPPWSKERRDSFDRKPRRSYTEEERKAASERMKKLRKERGSEWRKR